MFLLYHLLLAHVAAEFAFQPKELVAWKKKSIWGIIFHDLIFVVLAVFTCITYINIPTFLVFLFLIFTLRLIIDLISNFYVKFDNIATFAAEQSIKAAILFLVLFIEKLNIVKYLKTSSFAFIYNDDLLMLYLIYLIIIIYGGSFILFYIKKMFIDPSTTFSYDFTGIIERLIIFSFFIIGGYWLLLIPATILLKLYLSILLTKGSFLNIHSPSIQMQREKIKSVFVYDILASPFFAILIGMIIKNL